MKCKRLECKCIRTGADIIILHSCFEHHASYYIYMFGAKSLTTLLTCTCVVSYATMIVNHVWKNVSRSECDYSQHTNQHLQEGPATKPWKTSAGSANCLTQHFSMCTEVNKHNVRYLRHAYNTSVKGMFRWNFTIRIFCSYAFFHMNHLEGLSPYWEANSQLVKDISCLLWNLNVHYHIYKSIAMNSIRSLTNAVHIFIRNFFQISFNTVSYQCLSLASELPVGFPDELQYTLFISPMSGTCPTHYFSVWIMPMNSLKIFNNCVWITFSVWYTTAQGQKNIL